MTDAASPLQPMALCMCSNTDVKTPITELEAGTGRVSDQLEVKFEDGSRVRMSIGSIPMEPC